MEKIKKEDLKESEIYYCINYGNIEQDYIFKATKESTSCKYLSVSYKYWGTGYFGIENYRNCNAEEKHWFLECEKANKYIPKEEALKTFNEQSEFFIVGKWYKNIGPNEDYIGKFKQISFGNFYCTDYIWQGKHYYVTGCSSLTSKYEKAIECSLEKIQQYLPENHPDKIKKLAVLDPILDYYNRASYLIYPAGIFKELKKEAISIGFIKGAKFKDLVHNKEFTILNEEFIDFKGDGSQLYINVEYPNTVGSKTARIYDKGTWAAIISKSKEESKSLVGRYVKVLRNGIHCSRLVKDDIVLITGWTEKSRDKDNYWLTTSKGSNNSIYNPEYETWNPMDLELLPEGYTPPKESVEDLPEYWEYIDDGTGIFTKGKIYKIINKYNLEAISNFVDDRGDKNGFCGLNHTFFKPSTKKAFDIQNNNNRSIFARYSHGKEKLFKEDFLLSSDSKLLDLKVNDTKSINIDLIEPSKILLF